jgi:hypothetical protein
MFCVLTVLGCNAMPNSVVSTRLLMHTHRSLQAAGSDDSEEDAMSEASSSADVGDAQLHLRNVAAPSAINRVCCMHQQPGIVATWGENGAVSILNVSKLLTDLAAEEKPREKGKNSLLQVTSTCCHAFRAACPVFATGEEPVHLCKPDCYEYAVQPQERLPAAMCCL